MKRLVFIAFIVFPYLVVAQNHYGWTKKNSLGLLENVQAAYMNSNNEVFAAGIGLSPFIKSINLEEGTSELINSSSFPSTILDFYINQKDETNSMYVTHQNGYTSQIFVSTNNGQDWVYQGASPIQVAKIFKTSDGRLFTYSHEGIAVSTNNGVTWSIWNSSLSVFDVSESTGGKIYVGCEGGLYESASNGGLVKSAIGPQCVGALSVTRDNVLYYKQGVTDPQYSPTCVFGLQSSQYYYSEDEAATFESCNSLNNGAIIIDKANSVVSGYQNKKWLATSNYGMMFSDDSENWEQVISGPNEGYRNFDYFFQTNNGFLYGLTEVAIFKMRYSSYQEPMFQKIATLDGIKQIIELNNGDFAAVANSSVGNGFAVWTSSNGGYTWEEKESFSHLNKIAQFSNDKVIAITSNETIYYSEDGMQNWVFSGVNDAIFTDVDIKNDFAVSVGGGKVFYSSDTAQSWSQTYLFYPQNQNLTSVLITEEGTILAGSKYTVSGGYFYRSTDSAQTFSQIGDLTLGGPGVIDLIQNEQGRIFAGTTDGIHFSDDDGLTWEKDTTCPINVVSAIHFRSNGDLEVAGKLGETNYRHAFRKRQGQNHWELHIIPMPGQPSSALSTSYYFEDSDNNLFVADLWKKRNNEPSHLDVWEEQIWGEADESLFSIFPNPSKEAQLKYTGNSETYSMMIYTMSGKLLYFESQLNLQKNQAISLPKIDDKEKVLKVVLYGKTGIFNQTWMR